MASKIQVRRGFKQDLPILDSGEFGLAQDTQEVFMGLGNENMQLAKHSDIYYFTPEMFGKTGTADDTAVIQAMFDYIDENNREFGAKVHFGNKKYTFGTVTVKTPQTTITSSGLLDGSFTVQSVDALVPNAFNILPLNVVFDGVKFYSSTRKAAAITFKRLRDATIQNCYFENFDVAILGDSEPNFGWQRTARIRINDNVFKNCTYFCKTVLYPLAGDPQPIYHHHGDYMFEGNYFFQDTGGDTSLYLNGQDGAIIKGNYFFHGYSGIGRHIEINDSNYVIIDGNNFFEAPKESILADRPRHMVIKGNNFAIGGQDVVSSAIKLTNSDTKVSSEMRIIIDSNIIDGTSAHGIHVGENIVSVKIMNNDFKKIGTTVWKGTGSQLSGAMDIYVEDGSLLTTDTNGIKYKNDIIISGNSGENGVVNNRGVLMNQFWLAHIDAGNTFGNMKYGNAFSGVVDYKEIKNSALGVSNSPINPAFPILFKAATGTVSNIINAGINQMVWFVAGSAGLTIQTGSGMLTKTGSNLVLSNGQTALFMKSDSSWYQIS